MPYSPSDSNLPKRVQSMSEADRKQWCEVFNSIMGKTSDEGRAMAGAYAALKKSDLDTLEEIVDELEKAGARHSAADIKMFDQVATALKDVAAGITEGVLPLLDKLKSGESLQTPVDQIPTDQPKPVSPTPQPATTSATSTSKKNVDPNVVGSSNRDTLASGDFVDPDNKRFPVMGAADVMDAVHSFGRMGEPKMSFDEFKRKLIALCRRKGLTGSLPKSWQKQIAKAENLDMRTMEVREAFAEQFNLKNLQDPMSDFTPYRPMPFVSEVWDEYVIVGVPDEDLDCTHYKANYTTIVSGDNKGEYQFDDPVNWEEVERVWQVVPATKNVVVIGKQDTVKQLAYGVVLKPRPFEDTQEDVMEKEDIETTAHRWMVESRLYDLMHKNDLSPRAVEPVESYIAMSDMTWGEKTVLAGSWVVVSHVKDDKIWEKIKKGEINAYSIKGVGYRKEFNL